MKVNIKDFIINIEDEKKQVTETKTKVKNVPTVKYEVILENNTDFVVRRITSRTSKDLVILVSQSLFYIKDNKDESIKELNSLNSKKMLDLFFKDINNENSIQFEKVEWIKRPNINKINGLISNDVLQELYKYGIMSTSLNKSALDKFYTLFKSNTKLVRYFISSYGQGDLGYNALKTLEGVFMVYNDSGFNNAKYLVDSLKETGFLNSYNDRLGDFIQLINKFNLNTITFIDYITYGFKRQGVTSLEYYMYNSYRDYLKMNKDIYGVVKEKYPKYLKTQHDMLVYKYNIWNKYKQSLMIFEVSEENEYLAYTKKDYSIIIPKTPQDLLEEAVNNHNCLASYISRIADKETMVVFLRETSNIEQSLLTIEVKGKEIVQVEGYANSFYFDKEVEKFIKKWANEKELIIKCKLKVKEV